MKSANWISAHRPQAVDGRADRGADDHRLGQRRVDDPVVAELGPQPVGGQEHAALLADVLAEHDDRLVAAHLLGERLADGLDERPGRPSGRPSVRPSACLGVDVAHARSRGSGSGCGLGVVGRVVDGRLDLGGEPRLDRRRSGRPRRAAASRNSGQRVAAPLGRQLLLGAVLRLLVVRRVAGQARDLGLDEGRALAGPGPGDRLARRRVAGQHVGRRRRSRPGCRSRPPGRRRLEPATWRASGTLMA